MKRLLLLNFEGTADTEMVYDSETWVLNAKEERRKKMFNMKSLERALGLNVIRHD